MKIITKKSLVFFAGILMALCFASCEYSNVTENAEQQEKSGKVTINVSATSFSADSDISLQSENKSIKDIIALKNFILGITDKKNDIDNDKICDVFDLCMLKNILMKNKNTASSDILVAYFSCTGNTENIAGYIINHFDADSYEIIPEIPYTADDLNYNTDCRANREQNDDSARPKISGGIDNMNDYDIIFVGYPIWWGQAPKIMYTFLESYDFSGKTIIPFCTSGSSSIGTSAKNMQAVTTDSTIWLEGKRFSGNAPESDVISWTDSLNLNTERNENTMYITIGDTKLSAILADNSSAEALKELLKKEPLTIDMSDYANFEKVGEIGTNFPRNDEQITTEAGDLVLYLGSNFVIYYDTNSWNFTRLGKIDNISQEELKKILGDGDVTVTLSLE